MNEWYIAPLGDLLKSFGIDYHIYADNTQLYITIRPTDSNKLIAAKLKIEECVNSDKTEILVLSSCVINLCPKVTNNGVTMDSNLTMENNHNLQIRILLVCMRKVMPHQQFDFHAKIVLDTSCKLHILEQDTKYDVCPNTA